MPAIFDFVGPSMKGWSDTFTTAAIGALEPLTHRVKAVFTLNTSAAIFGLGYIMGLDYAAIILAGSMISYFVLVPLFAWFGPHVAGVIAPATIPLTAMTPEQLFSNYARPIGIGGIFAAGVISILKMSPVIVQAAHQVAGELARLARGSAVASEERTDRALPMSVSLLGIAAGHIAWAADYLPAGTYELTYTLVALQAGQYHVLPARAWQFYFPEVQGNSAGSVFEVTP